MPRILLALGLTALVTAPAPASRKPCRDGQGRVVKCPEARKAANARCKDGTGKFVKCDAPGARPASKG